MAEEPRLFLRSALFGLVIAVLYWWSTAEIAGTILLGSFGMAALLLVGLFFRAWQRAGGRLDPRPGRMLGLDSIEGDGRLADEPTRFPGASLAPLLTGLGVGVAALGLAWGPGFLVAAMPFLLLAAARWYQGSLREYPADPPSSAGPATGHRSSSGNSGPATDSGRPGRGAS